MVYKTLEEDLAECFKKRNLTITEIKYSTNTWTIKAKVDENSDKSTSS